MIWSICEATGWGYQYVMDGISWPNLKMMLADAPRYVSGKEKEKVKPITTSEELDEFLNL